MNSGESVVALAVGEGWSAVATSFGLLRVYSSTGIPIMLTCLNGPVVCMCGYLHTLAGIIHENWIRLLCMCVRVCYCLCVCVCMFVCSFVCVLCVCVCERQRILQIFC